MATPIPTNEARFVLFDIALATEGTIKRRGSSWDEPTVGVFSDSRAVTPGSVFVALKGESHDGHAFVSAAVEKGARVVVVERGRGSDPAFDTEAGKRSTVVEVDDTLVAWGGLARAHLTRWRMKSVDGRVVLITGSTGKTTTKELTAALLAQVAPTHYTAGNLNNRVGVPAVIFALESRHRYCVLEVGMSLPGELDRICGFARPDVSVIVNIGVAHSEGVGGREGVMKEKGAVFRALGSDGIAVVNTDDDFVRRAVRLARVRRIETFGKGGQSTRRPGSFADESPSSIRGLTLESPPSTRISLPPPSSRASMPPSLNLPHYRLIERSPERGGSRVVVNCTGRELTLHLPLPGEAAAIDLVAAIAAQEAASREMLSVEAIERALASVRLSGRNVVRTIANDIVVLDDTYNANPASMRAALATLEEVAGMRRRVAVLGEMKELGTLGEAEHVALGDAIADAGIALAIGCGGLIDLALARAAARGVEVVHCKTTEEAATVAPSHLRAGDAVVFKGSRGTRTELVLAAVDRAPATPTT